MLMPDHATLGGYPIVAVVIGGRPRLARSVRPWDRGVPRPVGIAEAVEAAGAAWRMLNHTVIGHHPLAVE